LIPISFSALVTIVVWIAASIIRLQERDVTHWLEYFVEGVTEDIDAVRERAAIHGNALDNLF